MKLIKAKSQKHPQICGNFLKVPDNPTAKTKQAIERLLTKIGEYDEITLPG